MHIAWSYAFSCPSDVSTGFDFCIFQIHMSYLKKIRKKRTVFNFFSILILDGTIIILHINHKPGNPIPLGVWRKGSFFLQKK